jgi:hypothetical protein
LPKKLFGFWGVFSQSYPVTLLGIQLHSMLLQCHCD